MKKLFTVIVLLFSATLFAGSNSIGEEKALEIAREYVVQVDYDYVGELNDELNKADEITESSYIFSILDASGDCSLTIVVDKNGKISKEETYEFCI